MDDRNIDRLRQASGYQPNFDIDLAYGEQGQLLVMNVIKALEKGHVEVKRDSRWVDTGNVYAEFHCRPAAGEWSKSGLATSDATLWAFVLADTECVLILPTATLKAYCSYLFNTKRWGPQKRNPFVVEEKDGSHPTRGIRVPLTGQDGLLEWLRKEAKKRRS